MHRELLIHIAENSPVWLSTHDLNLIDLKSYETFKANGWIVTCKAADGSQLARITPGGMRQAADYQDEMNDELDFHDPEWGWD